MSKGSVFSIVLVIHSSLCMLITFYWCHNYSGLRRCTQLYMVCRYLTLVSFLKFRQSQKKKSCFIFHYIFVGMFQIVSDSRETSELLPWFVLGWLLPSFFNDQSFLQLFQLKHSNGSLQVDRPAKVIFSGFKGKGRKKRWKREMHFQIEI